MEAAASRSAAAAAGFLRDGVSVARWQIAISKGDDGISWVCNHIPLLHGSLAEVNADAANEMSKKVING